MTDVTASQGQEAVELSAADEQLLRELTERARAGGLQLTGEGGLLGKLTRMVIEGALQGELDDHGCFKVVLGPALALPWLPGRDVVSRSGIGSAGLIMK